MAGKRRQMMKLDSRLIRWFSFLNPKRVEQRFTDMNPNTGRQNQINRERWYLMKYKIENCGENRFWVMFLLGDSLYEGIKLYTTRRAAVRAAKRDGGTEEIK
jgi:hypothetical protein